MAIPAEVESLVSEKTQCVLQARKQEEVQEVGQAQNFEIPKIWKNKNHKHQGG